MNTKTIMLPILVLFMSSFGIARAQNSNDLQQLSFTHLTLDDGLPHLSVYDIVQDEQGFMWFGTVGGGLVRYDGYEMKVYTPNDLSVSSISDDRVWDLFIDISGTLWVGTVNGGLNRYNRETDNFTSFLPDSDDPKSLPSIDFKVMCQTVDGTIWIGTTHGFSRFDPESGTFFTYHNDLENPQSISNDDVRDILEDSYTGQLWLATRRGGLSVFDRTNETFTNYLNDPDDPTSISNNAVNALLQDSSGNIWVGTSGGLDLYDPKTNTFITYTNDPNDPTSLGHNVVLSLFEDSQGRFWVGHVDGVDLFDRETENFIHYRHNSNAPNTIGEGVVRAIYEDRTGGIWIGTNGGGVSYLKNIPEKFSLYRNIADDPNSLSSDNVTALYMDKVGILWAGTDKGLNRFNGQTFTRYIHDPDNPNSISNGVIYSITEDAIGNLWIGTEDGRFDYFDLETQEFTHYQHNPEDPNVTNVGIITRLHVDKNNILWLHAEGYGLERFDGEDFTIFQPDEITPNSGGLPGFYIADMLEDQQKDLIWLAMFEGLVKMNLETETFITYRINPGTLGQNRIWSIVQSNDGTLWLTSPNGLYHFDPVSETFTHHYTIEDGLPSNSIDGIIKDQTGSLWLATPANGLSRIDPVTGTVRNFDELDGLASNQFRRHIVQAPDGRIYTSGPSGITAFYPDQITNNPNIPPVVLTDFELFDAPVEIGGEDNLLSQAINLTDEIILNYDQSVFTFEFSALNYTIPQKNQFAYMMEGFDTNWRTTSFDRRLATYTNLDPGDYTFRVIASNNDGVWNEEGVSLSIIITPPWWQTTWFRLAALLLLIVGIVATFTVQRFDSTRRERQLETQVAERTHELEVARTEAVIANQAKNVFLANMNHELRSPLHTILGFTRRLQNQTDLNETALNHLNIIYHSGNHLLSMINQVLDLSKIEAGKMLLHQRSFDLKRLLDDIEDMFQLRMQDKNLKFVSYRDENLPLVIHSDDMKLRQVLINLISNAVKFTPAGSITLTITRSGDEGSERLAFSITDTGQGIADEHLNLVFEAFFQSESGKQVSEGTGLGLTISRNFVQLLGGELQIKSQLGQGTTVYFDIPLQAYEKQNIPAPLVTTTRRITGLGPGQKVYRILVVDDRWSSRQLLVQLLDPLGFDIREAENGEQAVDIWKTWHPHLIWMDMHMPIVNGWEATKRIKDSYKGQDTVIVALTASTLEEERINIINTGCDDFLRKPFQDEEIFACMQKHLGVQFIYAESATAPQNIHVPQVSVMDELAALPAQLLSDLEHAAMLLDETMVNNVLAEVHNHNEILATTLRTLSDQFRYGEIVKFINTVKDNGSKA